MKRFYCCVCFVSSKNRLTTIRNKSHEIKFGNARRNSWEHTSSQKDFFDQFALVSNIKKPEDWYGFTLEDIEQYGGTFMKPYYGGNLYKALTTLYPSQDWKAWLFPNTPKKYWEDIRNRRKFFDWAFQKLELSKMEDWYKVKSNQLEDIGGKNLLRDYYNSSLLKALLHIYPEQKWQLWKWRNNKGIWKESIWKDLQKQKEIMEELEEKLGIKKKEDWYLVSLKAVQKVTELGANGLFKEYYNSSVYQALKTIYPEYPWKLELFQFLNEEENPWISLEYQRTFMDDIAKELNMKELDDWYGVDKEQAYDLIIKKKGSRILKQYKYSFPMTLLAIYPEHKWKIWKFYRFAHKKPLRDLFNQVAKQLKINKMEDWYLIKREEFSALGAQHLLSNFHNSVASAVISIFPEYDWLPWKFVEPSGKIVSNLFQQRKLFDEIGSKIGVKRLEDWYNIDSTSISAFEDAKDVIRDYFNGSLSKAITTLYPEFLWSMWMFKEVPSSYWTEIKNQRNFFDRIAIQLGVSHWEDWYSITSSDVADVGGFGSLKNFGGSHIAALIATYPELPWQIWRFEKVPSGFWEDHQNVREALEWAFKKLGLSEIEEWKTITSAQMCRLGLKTLIEEYGGLAGLLNTFLPQLPKTMSDNTSVSLNKSQQQLFLVLKEYFKDVSDLHQNYSHPSLIYQVTNKPMELDIFIPSLNLAFEYQGMQHYKNLTFLNNRERHEKDQEKKRACVAHGITLIQVPFWWDGSKDSLLATIFRHRADIVDPLKVGTPIPEHWGNFCSV